MTAGNRLCSRGESFGPASNTPIRRGGATLGRVITRAVPNSATPAIEISEAIAVRRLNVDKALCYPLFGTAKSPATSRQNEWMWFASLCVLLYSMMKLGPWMR